jgi:Dolichyl-phosphate-mannose-protein mannosyltransferase
MRAFPRQHGFVLGIALVAGGATLLFSMLAFPRGAPDLDEAAYRAQAAAVSEGRLTLPRNYDPSFRPFLSGVRAGKVVFKYQPEWPAIIAASERVFGSTLPLRFALSTLVVLAVYALTFELLRRRAIATLAALLVALSPFVWVQGATLLGYQLSLVLGTLAGWMLVRATLRRERIFAILGGVFSGLCVLHRPFDAVIMLAPIAGWAVWRAAKQHAIVSFVRDVGLGASPFVVLLILYNQAVMGRPWRMPFNVSGSLDRFGFGRRASFVVPHTGTGGQVNYTVGEALSTVWHTLFALPRFVAAAPIVAVAAVVIAVARRSQWQARLLTAMVLSVFVGYFFWWGTANAVHFGLYTTLGPFYHYPVIVPVAILAAWCLVEVARAPRLRLALVVLGVIWCIAASGLALRNARRAGQTQARAVAVADAPGRRLVFEVPEFPNDPYLAIANRADLGGARVVALDVAGERLRVLERFPNRDAYLVRVYRRLSDPFGPELHDRIRLHVLRAPEVEVDVAANSSPSSPESTYLRIGRSVRRSSARRGRFLLRASDLPSNGTTAIVSVGIARPDASFDHDEFKECRFEARVYADDIEVLTPCDGYQQYVFPDGKTATHPEDVSSVLAVETHAAP